MSGERTEVRLGHDVRAPASARDAVRRRLEGVLWTDRLEAAVLAADELVSNAVRHARPEADGRLGLRIDVLPASVRIVVTDGAPEFSWRGRVAAEPAGGFGLELVDRIADRWGVSLDGKKAVWFELDRS